MFLRNSSTYSSSSFSSFLRKNVSICKTLISASTTMSLSSSMSSSSVCANSSCYSRSFSTIPPPTSKLFHALFNQSSSPTNQSSPLFLQLSESKLYPYFIAQTILPPYLRMSVPPIENPQLPEFKTNEPVEMNTSVATSETVNGEVDYEASATEMLSMMAIAEEEEEGTVDQGLLLDSTRRKRIKKMKKHKHKKRLKKERHATRKTRT
jgi:hypothetical protein